MTIWLSDIFIMGSLCIAGSTTYDTAAPRCLSVLTKISLTQ